MKKIIFLALVVTTLAACSEENSTFSELTKDNVILRGAKMVSTYNKLFEKTEGNIYFNNQKTETGDSYDLNATFYTDLTSGQKTDIGHVSVNGVGMEYEDAVLDYELGTGINSADVVPNLFGNNVTFYSESRNCNQTFYMPDEIELTAPPKPGNDVRRFDRSVGIDLNWNPDPNNSEGVFIYVRWGGRTFNTDRVMNIEQPGANVESGAFVSDTGNFLLDDSVLSSMNLPKNAMIKIQLLRGHIGITENKAGMKCKAYGYSSFDFLAVAQ